MRTLLFIATAALQLFLVAVGFYVRSWQAPTGGFSFDLLAIVPPFVCYVVALYGAPLLLRRHPVVRFAAFAPPAMTMTLTVFYASKLIGHLVSDQFVPVA